MANNIINIKLLSAPPGSGPFTILDTDRNPLIENVSSEDMENGFAMSVGDDDTTVIVVSSGNCKIEQYVPFEDITTDEWADSDFSQSKTGCVWTHLKNNPFSYKYHDEILQNVKDYSKVYNYLPAPTGSFDTNRKVQVDNQWFNKAILYNGQQSTGVLNLVPKPENNLSEYLQYPILNTDSKTITYSKTDSFYQYNTFWALQKNDELPLFLTSCKSLSFDKEVNQDNMDYGPRSFKKSTLRAKNLKVRHILDNKSTTHIISQFIVTPSQISYK